MPSTHSYIPQKYWMSFKRPHLSLSEYPCFTSLLGSLVYSFGIKRTGPANTVQLCCSIRCSLERMLNRAETAFVTLFRMCFNAMCSMCLTRWMAVTCHRPAWSFFVYVFMLFHISQWVHQGNWEPFVVATVSVSHPSLHTQHPLILACTVLHAL